MKISELSGTDKLLIPVPGKQDQVEIVMKTDLEWGEWVDIEKDELEAGVQAMIRYIISWNLEGKDGRPLPIDKESMLKLPSYIPVAIHAKMNELNAVRLEKKTK